MRGFETWRPPLWPQTQAELKIMEKNINKDKVQPAACAHQGSARPVKNNTSSEKDTQRTGQSNQRSTPLQLAHAAVSMSLHLFILCLPGLKQTLISSPLEGLQVTPSGNKL